MIWSPQVGWRTVFITFAQLSSWVNMASTKGSCSGVGAKRF
jgi:hypothetical protein